MFFTQKTTFLAFRDDNGYAEGHLLVDDGQTKDTGFMNKVITVGENENLQTLNVNNGHAAVHLKAGKAVPYQPVTVKNTHELMTQKTTFLAFRDDNGYAEGHLLVDDGQTKDTGFAYWKLRLAQNTITFWLKDGDRDYVQPEGHMSQYVEKINILQAKDLANVDFACVIG